MSKFNAKRFNANRTCKIEGLETRQMMAGDMVAYTYGGDLYIHESPGQDGQNNNVVVSQPTAGTLRVQGGVNSNGTTTRIGDGTNGNFATYKQFNVNSFRNVYITTGDGHDVLAIKPGTDFKNNVSIDTSAPGASTRDADAIYINQAIFRAGLTVRTGANADRVELGTTSVNGALNVNTGAGEDVVLTYANTSLTGVTRIDTYTSAAEKDKDTVTLENTFGTQVVVDTGDGDDVITARNFTGLTLGGKATFLNLDSGAGNDTVTLEKVAVDDVFAFLGAGRDFLKLSGVKTKSGIRVDGGGDYDIINRPAVSKIDENIIANYMGIEEFSYTGTPIRF